MKALFKSATNIFGYGFVLNQIIVPYLEFISQSRETWMLLKNSLDHCFKRTENILCLQMEVYGFIAVVFWILSYMMSHASRRLEASLGVGER